MIILYIILVLLAALAACLLVAVLRTLAMPRKQTNYVPSADEKRIGEYAGKLSRMVQVETISDRSREDVEKFRGFHKLMRELFPKVFANCEEVEIDGNLLLRWKGKSDKQPILLMSHMDVVEATGEWSHAPFSGDIADGKVWGRGAADTKCSLMAFFQSVEEMIEEGYTPECDVYLASSCTEEIGGSGAPKLANWLREHGVKLFMLCDEGGSIIQNPLGGVNGHYAAVGIFEKGYGDVKFIARSHGVMPAHPAAIHPFPAWRSSSRRWRRSRPSGCSSPRRWRPCLNGLPPMPGPSTCGW